MKNDSEKLFDLRGFLTDSGKERCTSFFKEVDSLLHTAENETELRIIASILSNFIGKRTADIATSNGK